MSDLGSGNFRAERVLDPDREAGFRSGICRLGMDYFGAVICQFDGLFKADFRQGSSVGTDSRIGSEHAIHVGPDPDFICASGCTDDGGGIIGTSAAQRSGLTL